MVDLIDASEIAPLLKVDVRTVNERYAYRTDFPPHIKIGRKKLWKREDVITYIENMFNQQVA